MPVIRRRSRAARCGRSRSGRPSTGRSQYRVLASGMADPAGRARRIGGPDDRRRRGAVSVLIRTLVAVGAPRPRRRSSLGWFIIRRDLRPLEQIARTAGEISAGDLSPARRRAPRRHARSAGWATPSTRCSTRSRPRSRASKQALVAKERSEEQLRQFVGRRVTRAAHATDRGARLRRAVPRRRPGRRGRLEQAMARIGSESRRMARSSRTCCCSPGSTRAGRSGASRSTCRALVDDARHRPARARAGSGRSTRDDRAGRRRRPATRTGCAR